MYIAIFLTVVIIAIIIVSILIYNSLVAKKNEVYNIESAIDTILKKRFNLIPNLVEITKQYMNYEGDLLTKVTALRSQALNTNNSLKDNIKLDSEINSMIKPLMLNVENYPELQANKQFNNLQITLIELEEQLSAARRAYNQVVTDYNNALEMIPTNIFAKFMKYKQFELFDIDEDNKVNHSVKKLFNS